MLKETPKKKKKKENTEKMEKKKAAKRRRKKDAFGVEVVISRGDDISRRSKFIGFKTCD